MQRTLGAEDARLDDESPPETVEHPASTASNTSGATERQAHFMRSF